MELNVFFHVCNYTEVIVIQVQSHHFFHFLYETRLEKRPIPVREKTKNTFLGPIPEALGKEIDKIPAGNADRLFYHLYERVSPEGLKRKQKLEEEAPIKKGQKTRILRTKKTFNRGYEPNWTEESFTVKRPNYIRAYGLEYAMKEPIKGWFYRPQVQKVKVSPRKRYTIEKILKNCGKGEALI